MNDWLERRLPRGKQVTLSQRCIFIVPSKIGLALFALCLLIFMIGVNFQNALIYAICFWLVALFVINILHTYRNLAGTQVSIVSIQPCFSGEKIVCHLMISRPPHAPKYSLFLGWPEEDLVQVDLSQTTSMQIKLSHTTLERGYFTPPRIEIFTRYPTGLAIAWSYIHMDAQGIVYPKPATDAPDILKQAPQDHLNSGKTILNGTNDFEGIRAYQAGDAIRRIHWGKYAQTRQLYSKTFIDYHSQDQWIDWNKLTTFSTEKRLEQLCAQVLACHEQAIHFGLKIPNTIIEQGKGETHKTRCLTALARYGLNAETHHYD